MNLGITFVPEVSNEKVPEKKGEDSFK
jgi:hypothetical protein